MLFLIHITIGRWMYCIWRNNNFRMSKKYGEEGTDDIPDVHIIKCTAYMAVMKFKKWDLAVLIGGNRYKDFPLDYNGKLGNAIIEASRAFWQAVQDRTPPSAQTLDDLKLLYPKSIEGKTLEINAEVHAVIESYRAAKKEEKELGEKIKSLKYQMGSVIGDAETVLYEGKKVIGWKSQTEHRIDVDLLRAKYPNIAKECEKIGGKRVFR